MLTGILSHVLIGWAWRRVQELSGLALALVPLYLSLPIQYQDALKAVLTGQGGGLTISTAIGFGLYIYGQWRSLRSTSKNQIVIDGKKATDLANLPVFTLDEMATQIQRETGVRPKSIPDLTK